jgi:thiaminase
LELWTQSRVLRGLRDAVAHYDENDIWRALLATMVMFRWLAAETGEQLSYPYPAMADERVTEWVRACRSEKARIDTRDDA